MKNLLLLLLSPLSLLAQIPEYYNSIDFTQTGDDLKNQLTTLITNTHTTQVYYTSSSFTDTWDVIKASDLDPINSQDVLLIYGYIDTDGDPQSDRTRDVTLSCHTSSCTGLWNREHVYAQSLATPPLDTSYPSAGTDVHNLRACDSEMNSSRSNRLFETGTGNAHITSNGRFFPGDEWKGDVARILMYMYLRYPTQCLPINIAYGTTNYAPNHDMIDVLLEWNTIDPVSQFETNRNNEIYNVQGNRNPFIDNPYIATLIWNGPVAQDTWGTLATQEYETTQNITIYPTFASDYIYISNPKNQAYTYQITDYTGKKIESNTTQNPINIDTLSKGVYFFTVQSNNTQTTFRFIKY
jgi:endonuclease I